MPGSGEAADPQVASALAAGSAAAGRALLAPVRLAGSDRSLVLRCRDDAGLTVVVKTYPADQWGPGCFAAEAAGLAVTRGTGLGPDLVAADPASLTVVMSDLGSGPSLADALLGGDAGAARQALLAWARDCGALAAAASARLADFETLKSRYLAGRPDYSGAARLQELILRAGDRAAALAARPGTVLSGLRVPGDLAGDLRAAGLRKAVAAWSLSSFGWLLDRALDGDDPMEQVRVSPTARQLIRHRWRVLLEVLEADADLPALAALTRSLLAVTGAWQAADLPLYPAFR